jgi:hypothetical protein
VDSARVVSDWRSDDAVQPHVAPASSSRRGVGAVGDPSDAPHGVFVAVLRRSEEFLGLAAELREDGLC